MNVCILHNDTLTHTFFFGPDFENLGIGFWFDSYDGHDDDDDDDDDEDGGWMGGWMDGWMEGWTDGRTDGWMGGKMDGCIMLIVIRA